METSQEVDKILDTSCTIDQERYDMLSNGMKHYYNKIVVNQNSMNILQSQLHEVAIDVAFRLTDFREVLNYLQDESLAKEIILDARESDFTRKKLESYRKSLLIRDSEEDEENYYQVGTVDSFTGLFDSMIQFPKSFLYRADWIYKLVVEKEAYEIKQKRG